MMRLVFWTDLRMAAALLLLILANIALGSADAWIAGNFDRCKFWRGVWKGLIVFAAFALTYLAGWLNPTALVLSMGGAEVNLMVAVSLILLSGAAWYAKEVLGKLAGIVKARVEIQEKSKQ